MWDITREWYRQILILKCCENFKSEDWVALFGIYTGVRVMVIVWLPN